MYQKFKNRSVEYSFQKLVFLQPRYVQIRKF